MVVLVAKAPVLRRCLCRSQNGNKIRAVRYLGTARPDGRWAIGQSMDRPDEPLLQDL